MAPNCGVPMNHLCSLSNSTQERPLARSDAPDRATSSLAGWPRPLRGVEPALARAHCRRRSGSATVRDRHGGADRAAHGASRCGALATRLHHGQRMSATLGVDVGGTFTDFFLVDEETGETRTHKVASTPDDPSRAILQGLRALVPKGGLAFLAHGTTVATNALIQRRGGKVALVTTAGFKRPARDRPPDPAQDVRPEGRPPRAARAARAPLRGRRAHRPSGEVDPAARRCRHGACRSRCASERAESVRGLLSLLVPQSGARAAHGRGAAGGAARTSTCRSPARCSRSSASTSGFRPPCSTPILQPVVGRYISPTRSRRSKHAPQAAHRHQPVLGRPDVGRRAPRMPIRTALSGPAAGVVGADPHGAALRPPRSDHLRHGRHLDGCLPHPRRQGGMAFGRSVAGFPVRLPSIDIHAVGAGGGSIAWIGRDGLMKRRAA